MARRYSRDPDVDRSLRHSVRDGVASSVQSGAGENYFNAFAVHLKATTPQIALLASLPPLAGSLAQLLSAWLGQRIGNRRDLILLGVRLQLFMWLPIVVLPLLFPEQAVTLFVICIVLYHGAANLAAPQWSSLMGELVPERKRGRYFALRNRLGSITSFLALIAAGLVLHLFDGAGLAFWGFVLIFLAASAGRVVSLWHLAQMHDPPAKAHPADSTPDAAWWRRLQRSPFARFSLFFALMQLSVAIASPFFTVYMLRDLHFSYFQFTVNTAASVLMQVLSLNTWGRWCDRYGNRRVLVLAGSLIPLLPVFWLMTTDPWLLLLVQGFGGASWAGFSLAAANYLYELTPSHRRVGYLARHNVLANGGVLIGALSGAWLAATLTSDFAFGDYHVALPSPLLWVFFISFLARFAVAATLLPRLCEVRPGRRMEWQRLLPRLARAPSISSLATAARLRLRLIGYVTR